MTPAAHDLVALRGEIRREMASDKSVSAGHQYGSLIVHFQVHLRRPGSAVAKLSYIPGIVHRATAMDRGLEQCSAIS